MSLMFKGLQVDSGGEGGIRTLGTFDSTPDFESGTFDHSATSPNQEIIIASDMKSHAADIEKKIDRSKKIVFLNIDIHNRISIFKGNS